MHPYQPQINITKALRKTSKLKQSLKLAYIHLFSECRGPADPCELHQHNRDPSALTKKLCDHRSPQTLSSDRPILIGTKTTDSLIAKQCIDHNLGTNDSPKNNSAGICDRPFLISAPRSFDFGTEPMRRLAPFEDSNSQLHLLSRIINYNSEFFLSSSK